MDIRLQAFADAHGGVFSRSVALRAGFSDDGIQANINKRRIWRRVRPGVYIEADRWDDLDDVGRHLATAHAVSLRCADDAVFSHVTGAIIRGWPTWGVALDEVCVTRSWRHSGRREAGVHHFEAPIRPDQVDVVSGLRVGSKERLMVDAVREYDLETAIVICDAALRAGADRDEACRILMDCYVWSKTSRGRRLLDLADGRAANPAESRLRIRLHAEGLPTPTPQAEVRSRDGRLLGRGDLLYEEQHTLVEFDGKLKYGIDLDGTDPRERLFREKRREDLIREEAGLEVVRVTWADLANPGSIAARVRAAFARASARRVRSS